MSSFDLAIPVILKHEGGLREDPNDPGGITNMGISLRFLKNCGLKYDFNGDGVIDEREIRELTPEHATLIYRNEFWDLNRYDRIINQAVATKTLDLCVNVGAGQAHKLIQRAVWALDMDRGLADDGVIGNKSIMAINALNTALLPPIRAEQAGFYRLLVRIKPTQAGDLNGLLNRAYSI